MAVPVFTEDAIDDTLYYARINSLTDLEEVLSHFSSHSPPSALLPRAIDSSSGNSALHMSAANGHLDSTNYILTHSPSLCNFQNHSGSTPLHYAALNGHLEIVKLLVETGNADVEIRNAARKTAFDEAENAGHEEVGRWLAGKMKGTEVMKRGDGEQNEGKEEEEPEMIKGVQLGNEEDGLGKDREGGEKLEGLRGGVGDLRIDEDAK